MRKYEIFEIDNIKINGRTNGEKNPLTLFWTASGFEVNVNGSEMWIEIEADYDSQEPWFSILINGVTVSRQMATKGESKICVFRNRSSQEIKNVRFVKDSQAMNEDEKCLLQVKAIHLDGDFCEVEEKPHKIEFIGDSITSGEGLIGAKKEMDWVSMFFSGVKSYAAQAAEQLQADFRIVSQSGWGVYMSWDGKKDHILPACYEQICGLLTGKRNEELKAKELYDFKQWQPELVVINLGTNDNAALNNDDIDFDMEEFICAVEGFLKIVRKNNAEAQIVWLYGMLGSSMNLYINKGIYNYMQNSMDNKVHYLQVPATTQETVGAREHPGYKNHKIAAQTLVEFVKNEFNW